MTTSIASARRALPPLRGTVLGSAAALGLLVALSALMFAFRAHLSVATVGLVLVLPVVAAVVAGGAVAGGIALAAGVLVYDVAFIPPYGSLTVGHPQDWLVLAVYGVVMALVARVANGLRRAEEVARARTAETHRLFVLSELLVGERSLPELLELIVSSVRGAFAAASVVLLLPEAGVLRPVSSAGQRLGDEELARLTPAGGVLSSLASGPPPLRGAGVSRTVVLAAAGRPVGLLVVTGLTPDSTGGDLLATFANHIALALERAQLREAAVQMSVLEEVDRLRRALIGTVSHDLRTPLATIKAASSTLLDRQLLLPEHASQELLELIEAQTDRLTRLVANLLDMSRIQSGALVPDVRPVDLRDLVADALAMLRPPPGRVRTLVADGAARVEVDHVFITEVLVNLLENALRHAPAESQVVVDAERRDGHVVVSVTDHGPGVPLADRADVFERAARRGASGAVAAGGTGVGLTIVKAFVEAHGGTVSVEDAPGGGARFCFEVAAAPPAEAQRHEA